MPSGQHNGPVSDDRTPAGLAAWLVAADGPRQDAREVLAATPKDPLAAGGALRRRHPDLAADQAAAVLEQATLAALAADRYGITEPLLLTRDGLEAATRPAVAARRARLLVSSGARRVVDLTAGLGFDARSFAAAGLDVVAVERDPVTAAYLRHNCPTVQVIESDATDATVLADLLGGLGPEDVVFVDPARRDPAGPRDRATGRARPERDPERWSPPWSFVAALPHPRIAAKAPPGFTPPPHWAAEWVSIDRTLVECTAYSWPAIASARQAVVLSPGLETLVPVTASSLAVAADLGAWIHEPDPAVLRAGALASLAGQEGLLAVDLASSWLTGDRPSTSPALRSHLVIERLTGSERQQRRRLADLDVRRATVKCRDVDAEPGKVLRGLGLTEGPGLVLALTRHDGQAITLLVEPAAAR